MAPIKWLGFKRKQDAEKEIPAENGDAGLLIRITPIQLLILEKCVCATPNRIGCSVITDVIKTGTRLSNQVKFEHKIKLEGVLHQLADMARKRYEMTKFSGGA
jgi:hypothetical protein